MYPQVVYGREPPSLLAYVLGTAKVAAVEEELIHRDQVLKHLKDSLKAAQAWMKRNYDLQHREEYEVGTWVFVQLQLFQQTSIALWRNVKLAPWYYGPFCILQRISSIAYKLELPQE